MMTDEELKDYFIEECSVAENVIRLGTSQLDRGDYLQIKKILESRGGKWKGGTTAGFIFGTDVLDIFASLCSGDTENKKNLYQFFPTPDDLAERMVQSLNIDSCRKDVRILEPSAGRGSLIDALRRCRATGAVDAYEINPDCWPFLEKKENVILHREDFLDADESDKFDYIIANPPFAGNADVRHFKKMWSVLKRSGRMTVIVSSHAMEAGEKTAREFREWLYSLHPAVEELGNGVFKVSGTDVNTYLITVNKS